MQEEEKTLVWSLDQEDSWRRAWQPTPVFLLVKIPWTERPGRLQSMELQKVGHDWVIKNTHTILTRVTVLYIHPHLGNFFYPLSASVFLSVSWAQEYLPWREFTWDIKSLSPLYCPGPQQLFDKGQYLLYCFCCFVFLLCTLCQILANLLPRPSGSLVRLQAGNVTLPKKPSFRGSS